jgi:tRNA modification GTPase
MDLLEAEGVADLIDAETSAQRKQALRLMEGALSVKYEAWRSVLMKALAYVEAFIDFAEETDFSYEYTTSKPTRENLDEIAHGGDEGEAQVRRKVAELVEVMKQHIEDKRGERLRQGARIILAGAPNAGKSSLLNALAQRNAAIVSPIPGTTRDAIEVPLTMNGYPVLISDTAGIRKSHDSIEQQGVAIAKERCAC